MLEDQAMRVVEHWRSRIIASIPNLARHSRSPEGNPLPNYLAASNLRFEQWILDTCLRPYDQDWINYQQEIALRHTTLKKNKVDGVQSTPYVPLRDIIAFLAVINETIKPYLAAKEHSAEDVDGMQRKGQILAFLMRLKQICNHPSQWLGDGAWAEEDSGKFARLRDSPHGATRGRKRR